MSRSEGKGRYLTLLEIKRGKVSLRSSIQSMAFGQRNIPESGA